MNDREIRVREVSESDYISIYELNKNNLGYDYDVEKTARQLEYILRKPGDKLLAAVIEGEVAGYIHASAYDCTYSDPFINILALVVDSGRRGLGVGRGLLTAIEEWAGENGCAGIRLTSGYNRTGAHKFYEACGYVNRKDQKNFVKVLEA